MNTNTYFMKLLAVILAILMPIVAHGYPGDLYATDNSSIRIYAPDGTERIFASGLPRPRGLAFDGFGNLFVATLDTSATFHDGKGQILKFGSDGTVTVFAAGAGLESPAGLAFDGAGNLWDTSNYFSRSNFPGYSPRGNAGSGRVTEIIPSGERNVLHLDPTTYHQNFGIAIDGQNNLFVADNLQSAIYKITPDRGVSKFVCIFDPVGLAFDTTGNLYASAGGPEVDEPGTITKIAPDGIQTLFVSGVGSIRGLAFDHNGNLFGAGHSDNVIYKITPDESVSIFATGLDVPQFLAVEP